MDRGARLGPYEIVEQLGAGGMGEVSLVVNGLLRQGLVSEDDLVRTVEAALAQDVS